MSGTILPPCDDRCGWARDLSPRILLSSSMGPVASRSVPTTIEGLEFECSIRAGKNAPTRNLSKPSTSGHYKDCREGTFEFASTRCGSEHDLENNPHDRKSEQMLYGTDVCRTEAVSVEATWSGRERTFQPASSGRWYMFVDKRRHLYTPALLDDPFGAPFRAGVHAHILHAIKSNRVKTLLTDSTHLRHSEDSL